MKARANIIWAVLTGLAVIASCAKKEAPEKKIEAAKKSLISKTVLKPEGRVKDVINSGGYELIDYKAFPTQEQGVKGRIALYGADKKKGGGIIYLKKTVDGVFEAWHWFFADMVPDSAVQVEINEDGLWDLRIFFAGKEMNLIQDESFTLMGEPREDWLAMNGGSSAAVFPGNELWRCFDADTGTSWRSSLDNPGGASIELNMPFGVHEGILTIVTGSDGRPEACEFFADGKRIDSFSLKDEAGRQMVRLPSKAAGARTVKLAFKSVHGGGKIVAIYGLMLK